MLSNGQDTGLRTACNLIELWTVMALRERCWYVLLAINAKEGKKKEGRKEGRAQGRVMCELETVILLLIA